MQVSKEEFFERLVAAAEHAPQLFAHFKSAAAAKKAGQTAALEKEVELLKADVQKSNKIKRLSMTI